MSAPLRTKIRVICEIRVLKKYSCYPSIRVQKIQSDIRVQKSRVPHVSAPPRTKIREIGEIRVPKNIRVIRVITSLRSVGLRRISCSKNTEWHPCSKISCSKHLVRASKFIIGQFHIAASRNNSTFNIQKSKLRSAPPCAKNIFVLSALFVFKKIHGDICVQKSRVPHVSAPPRTKIREIGEIRVPKNIRVIRVITSLRSVGLRRISCSKEYIKGYALNWVLTKYILNDK